LRTGLARRLAPAALIAGVIAHCPPAPASPAGERLVHVGDFTSPLYLTAPPHDRHRLFVVERGGAIQVVRDRVKQPLPFLDVSADIARGGERGLLSMAFPPDYQTTGRFYIFYTASDADGDLRIQEVRRSAASADRADPETRRTVLTIDHHESGGHNGGQLQVGPDGMLYVGTGDGGKFGDSHGHAQDTNHLLGKLLRIDPRPTRRFPYRVPIDNPFVGRRGSDAVWDYGLRNPWRFSFDLKSGDLAITDVGEASWEEVDLEPHGSHGGLNFGWNRCEARHAYPPTSPPSPCRFAHTAPVLEYAHGVGTCAITGGYVVRDPALTGLRGRYLYADYCKGTLRSAKLARPSVRDDRTVVSPEGEPLQVPRLASFGQDAGGCVYVISLTGPVYRLAADTSEGPGPCPPRKFDFGLPAIEVDPPSAQRHVRERGLLVRSRCDEFCAMRAFGYVSVLGSSSRLALHSALDTEPAGVRGKFRLALTDETREAVDHALDEDKRVYGYVRVRARDAARNARTSRRIRVRILD
jgi:glucose/arabinose dehydrogenase